MEFDNYKQLKEKSKFLGYYGIPYLDDKLKGIFCGELILVGAYPGRGKSTIADIIFNTNDKILHNVKLFSLENFPEDFYWKTMFELYKFKTENFSITYREFMNKKDNIPDTILEEFDKAIRLRYKDSAIQYRGEAVSIDKLDKAIQDSVINEGKQIIIIDHLDYIDKEYNENDNDHITRLMSAIRNCQLDNPCAVIAISHLRKQEGRAYIKVPDENEFMGSSNKVKQATTVITFSPNTERDSLQPFTTNKNTKFNTWIKVCKDRFGAFNGKTANVLFDTTLGKYTYPDGVSDYQHCEEYINSFGKELTTKTKE